MFFNVKIEKSHRNKKVTELHFILAYEIVKNFELFAEDLLRLSLLITVLYID